MRKRQPVKSTRVELDRLGAVRGVIEKDREYLIKTGSDAPTTQKRIELGHEDFLRYLHRLRYPAKVEPESVSDALQVLGEHASKFLPPLWEEAWDKRNGQIIQVDLVAEKAELWAFPFEACLHEGKPVFADPERPIVLTRRIRHDVMEERLSWPVEPRVLFAHAPIATDLPEDLIASHVSALEAALRPWSSGGPVRGTQLLRVREVLSAHELGKIATGDGGPFTHVHLLSHGVSIPDPELPQKVEWGLRLGEPGDAGTSPGQLAEALAPIDGLPVVVTIAACDGGNQGDPVFPERSFAQELHVSGVPVVLASQLPLTVPGSVVLTEVFYTSLLAGNDVRWAVHESRLALRASETAGHDWVSLVGYVRLPEGYEDDLINLRLKRELALLNKVRKRVSSLPEDAAGAEQVANAEEDLDRRIASLEAEKAQLKGESATLDEAQGLIASAYKRLAELRFSLSLQAAGDEREGLARSSRESLRHSLDAYASAFKGNLNHHWSGVQQLALEAALEGAFSSKLHWPVSFLAAELDRDRSETEYWASGSLAELHMLGPLAGRDRNLDEAKGELTRLRDRSAAAGDPYAIEATVLQLDRYVNWWTKDNGFFGDRASDLAEDARELRDFLAA